MEFDPATLIDALTELGSAAWAEGKTIDLTSVDDAVASFYPKSQLQPKVQFGLGEIFSDMASVKEKPA